MRSKKISQIFAMLKSLGMPDEMRKLIAFEASDQRTMSLKELTDIELDVCIGILRRQGDTFVPLAQRKMLSKLKAKAIEAIGYKSHEKPDWGGRVIPYIEKISGLRYAEIKELDGKSLSKLVTQMEQVSRKNADSRFSQYVDKELDGILKK